MKSILVEEKDASGDVCKIYDEIKATLGTPTLPNWVKALGINANLLRANWEKAKYTLVKGEIPSLLKELLIFKVSVENGSPYCASCHAHSALQLDKSLSFDDLVDFANGKALTSLPKTYQVALEIIPRVAMYPQSFCEKDIEQLKAHGYTDANITELLAQGDLALMFNNITISYGVPIDEEYRPVQVKSKEMLKKVA